MGLRNGKLINFRSILSGSTSTQDVTNPSLSLLSYNSLPIHQSTTLSYSNNLTTNSNSTNNNNNNNNNNNSTTDFHSFFYYGNLINHASLDPSGYFPMKLDILLDRPPVQREKQIEYGWNHEDRSMNIFVKQNDPCTFHRHVIEILSLSLSYPFFFSSLSHKVPML